MNVSRPLFKQQQLRQLWHRFRAERALSWAGLWLFTCSCSFNNSFQDGCIGSVRVTVPEHAARTSHRRHNRKQHAQQADVVYASHHSLLPRLRFQTAKFFPQRTAPSEQTETAQRALHWWEQPGLDALLQADSPREAARTYLKRHKGIEWLAPTQQVNSVAVLSSEPEQVWRQRPEQVQVCFHASYPNKGWGRIHQPKNTKQLKEYCQAGYPMGRGKLWYIVNDTYATSHIGCRLFFSRDRVYIVAQCGQTLYRNAIRQDARCLQTGSQCDYPAATLHKLPNGTVQEVEAPKQLLYAAQTRRTVR
ncbi:MAG TPA: hypothetical protein DCE42_06975 [Myxococcales bacterium]|nr:hypothetical protein [Deltaproteobacteria bacterium]MBU48511.1 hypothetical protein [Deltaproteobacteria bacterium]HAA54481.1 hypothetical protein [Myxococcales bacterium]